MSDLDSESSYELTDRHRKTQEPELADPPLDPISFAWSCLVIFLLIFTLTHIMLYALFSQNNRVVLFNSFDDQ